MRIGLDSTLRIEQDGRLVTTHRLRSAADGWATVPEYQASLWQKTLPVEQRSLAVYEEVGQWS